MTKNLPATSTDLLNNLTNVAQRAKSGAGSSGTFLRLSKGGFWIYGSDDIEVEENALWAVDPNSLSTGYVAWSEGGEILGEEMALAQDGAVALAGLPNVGAPWQAQVAMNLVCATGEDTGTPVVFKSSSRGGQKRYSEFVNQIMAQYAAGDTDKVVPIILLESDHYPHKKYGKIYEPIFTIQDWMTLEEGIGDVLAAATDSDDDVPAEPEPEPEPKPRRGKAATVKAPEKPEKPVRRRRKRSATK